MKPAASRVLQALAIVVYATMVLLAPATARAQASYTHSRFMQATEYLNPGDPSPTEVVSDSERALINPPIDGAALATARGTDSKKD